MKKTFTILGLALLLFGALFTQAAIAQTAETAAKYNEYYNNGVTLFKAKKYSSAILEFKKVLRAKPYDITVKNSLVSCYLARADFYINENNDPKKGIIDLKNALFYMKYWGEEQNRAAASLITSTTNNLNALEARYNGTRTAAQKLEGAKLLRTQGELQAAGYDLNQLFSDPTHGASAIENAGDIYKSLNNNFDAINCYRKVIKMNEKNAGVHFKYAMILNDINNAEAAAEEFNLALKYGENNPELLSSLENLWLSRIAGTPNDPDTYMNLAIILQKKGDYEGAQAQYFKALSIDPDNKDILYNIASLYTEQKNYAGAVGTYNKLLAKEPNNKEILVYKAIAQEKIKDLQGAVQTYKEIAELDPNGTSGKNAKADIARILSGSFSGTELLAYLKTQADKDTGSFNAQYDYAFEAHKAEQFDNAIKYYERALALNPKHVEGYINLAQIYSNKNDFTNAKNIVNKGLIELPKNQKLLEQKDILAKSEAGDLYKIATKYWDEKKYDLALKNYQNIPIQTPEVLSAIAGCYSELNNYEKAIEYYKMILEKTPKDISALEGVAGAYLEMNKLDESKVYLEKILAVNPNNVDAKNALNSLKESKAVKQLDDAISLYENKEFQKAMTAFNNIIGSDPNNAYAYYYKALIFDEQKKSNDAIAQYKKAISTDPKFSLAVYGLAIALDGAENYTEAIQNYDKYLALRTAEGAKTDDYIAYVRNRSAELKKYLQETKK